MSHATPAEIHDHAYGFRPSPHVAACPECGRLADRVSAEGAAIREALSEEPASLPVTLLQAAPPARRHALSLASLAAAAVLLATLAWLLFRSPRSDDGQLVPAATAQAKDDLDRLIDELKGPSAARREMATLALRTYGPAAVEKLQKAQADPKLIEACRGVTPEMQAIEKKIETMKVDLAFQNTPLEDIVAFLRDFSGLNILIDSSVRADLLKPVALQAKDFSLKNVLKLLLSQYALDYRITPEGVVLITNTAAPQPLAKVPIRVPGTGPTAERETEALGSDSPEERDRASTALRAMGFGGERPLWKALDSPSAETRARASDLLRRLYSPERTPDLGPLEAKLRSIRITIDLQNAALPAIAGYLSEISKVSFVFDPTGLPNPESEMISFKVQDIVLDGALRLMLTPRDMEYATVGEIVLITRAGRILKTPSPPFWTAPEEARRMESLLADLASSDVPRQRSAQDELLKKGAAALGPLAEASHVFAKDAAGRCRALRQRIAEQLQGWIVDEPSGADRQTLTAAQRAILAHPIGMKLGEATLKELVESRGFKATFKAGASLKPAGSLDKATLGSFLRATLRPGGLDFALDGETIVVDTAARIRDMIK